MTFEPFISLAATRRGHLGAAVVLILGFAPPAAVHALSTDRDQPIEIEADSADQDEARGITIYRGDVVIVQGTLRITGNLVTIYSDENGDFAKMVTLGKPARFSQLPDGAADEETNYQRARASRMEYFKDQDLIVLLGEAVYGKGGDRVAADRIEYDSRKSRMKANTLPASKDSTLAGKKASTTKKGRVRITLQPKKKNQDSAN